ncbi:MAG TPA: four helix bundle protein [Saprospiraceae bacterium]|nr:four helix bundle protein [Saprospiraceae bacterium]
MNKPKYDLEDRLIEFGARIIKLVDALPSSIATRHLGGQLVRSGTAPALLYGEAQAAESRSDFIHKMKIGLKELRETKVSLKLLIKSEFLPPSRLRLILQENDELIAIFVTSVITANGNRKKH